MSKNFEFNAPQFINFAEMDDPNADRFFDIGVKEDKQTKTEDSHGSKVTEAPQNKEKDVENEDPVIENKTEQTFNKKNLPILRKVLHEIVNHQIQGDKESPVPSKTQAKSTERDIIQHFEKLHLCESKQTKSKVPIKATEVFSSLSDRKSHQMITRLDAMNQREEKTSKASNDSQSTEDCINVICDHQVSSTSSKSKTYKRNGSPLYPARKFISLAEQVEHFHKDTPERFRSKPKKPDSTSHGWISKQNCVPKTPKLATRFRQRKIDYPNELQREEMELEEIKKHQIKAYPLNEKILMEPSLNLKVPVIKKPATIPQPFSLTEVKKKDPPKEPVYHFKAQPVPTVILQGPVGIPPKKITTPTLPTTPQIRVPMRYRVEAKTTLSFSDKASSSDSVKINTPRNTKVQPFSFDARMKEMLQKKEEYVKKVIEEEKKSFNSFKANPMPAFKNMNEQNLKHDSGHTKTEPRISSWSQSKENKSFSESQNGSSFKITPFKARPATVVHQKPFVPKIEKHELLFPVGFQLNTEKRAAERQKFDNKIKQKEEERDLILKLQKEEQERLEQEKILEERKKLEFKAKPMPRFKVFEIHGSDPEKLTFPQSPMLSFKKKMSSKVEH